MTSMHVCMYMYIHAQLAHSGTHTMSYKVVNAESRCELEGRGIDHF